MKSAKEKKITVEILLNHNSNFKEQKTILEYPKTKIKSENLKSIKKIKDS